MSGGNFDYKQYCIGNIADSIVMEIARAKQPLPPPIIRKWVTCKIKIGKNSFSYDGSYWRRFESIDEVKEYFSRLGGTKILSEETLPNGESQITIHFKRTNEKRIFTSYTEQTIKEFKNAIRTLRMAQVYAQRVDWLICGDDSEDSFHERLAEELANITDEQIEKEIQEQINYLINDGD